MLNGPNRKKSTGFPHNLYNHLDSYLKSTKERQLTNREISGVVLTVALATNNLALVTHLLERYPSTFDTPSITLSKKAIQFIYDEKEAALDPETLGLSDEDEELFYLMLMVIAYIEGFSIIGLFQKLVADKTRYSNSLEVVYLANLTESLAYFYPGNKKHLAVE